ncbi:MAG: transglutaminase family protein, partial [uncultured bacterium]
APSYIPVSENWSTLVFNVSCAEAVPSNLVYLLPTRDVNCGNKYVRDYAKHIAGGLSTDTEKAVKIFEFLVNGDANGKFVYTYYNEIYPGILEQSWNTIFMPSHFLVRRQGVCNDFAELFAAMCRTHGMDVKRKSGDDSTGAGHQWNLIYLDGAWKRVDATWANSNPTIYKTFAELYPEFDATEFTTEHENKYTSNATEEY